MKKMILLSLIAIAFATAACKKNDAAAPATEGAAATTPAAAPAK